MKRVLCPWIVVCILSMARIGAQEEAPAEVQATPTPTPAPVVGVEFSVFVWPTEGILMEDSKIPGIPRVFYRSPRGPEPLRLMRNTATPLHTYQGSVPLVFFDIKETWADAPEDAPPGTPQTRSREAIPIFKAEFSPQWKRVMIIVFPQKKNADGTLLTMTLPYDRAKLSPGMARIYNSTNRELSLQFEDAQDRVLKLQPNRILDFDPDKLTDESFSRIFIYGRGRKDRPEMLHTSKLFFQEDTTNYFLLYGQGERRIRILRVAGHKDDDDKAAVLP